MMKKTFVRILALMLALVLTLPLVSCSKGLFDGVESSAKDVRVVGTVGKYEVCYDELYYLIMSCKDMMKSKYGDGIWDSEQSAAEYGDELREMVLERITANYAVLTLCDEYGFENAFSDKDLVAHVNNQIEETIYLFAVNGGISVEAEANSDGSYTYTYEDGGRDKAYELFKKELELTYLNERVMRLTLATEIAFSTLTNILTGEKGEIAYTSADLEDYMFSDKFICTRHVFIENEEDEDVEENRALAEALLNQYRNGSTMEELIGSRYNDDFQMPVAGYYFTYGEMDEPYEKAAFALKEGEVSGVVQTEDGFFIIERYTKSSTYILGNFETFALQITYALVDKKVSDRQAELSIEFSDYGKSLDFVKIAVEGEAALKTPEGEQ